MEHEVAFGEKPPCYFPHSGAPSEFFTRFYSRDPAEHSQHIRIDDRYPLAVVEASDRTRDVEPNMRKREQLRDRFRQLAIEAIHNGPRYRLECSRPLVLESQRLQ